MFVNGDPIDSLAIFIGPVGVPLVMLHVDRVVVGLRMATGDRLDDSEKAIQQRQTEKWIVNEVMSDAVDVGVHHQRINKSQDEHDPKRCVREKEEESEEEREVDKLGQRRHDVPARVRKNFRIGSWAFDIRADQRSLFALRSKTECSVHYRGCGW